MFLFAAACFCFGNEMPSLVCFLNYIVYFKDFFLLHCLFPPILRGFVFFLLQFLRRCSYYLAASLTNHPVWGLTVILLQRYQFLNFGRDFLGKLCSFSAFPTACLEFSFLRSAKSFYFFFFFFFFCFSFSLS